MKKTTLAHSEISAVIAQLGHTDIIVIGDMGLPVPPGVKRIDLAITKNEPRFKVVLDALLTEMAVESCIIASEANQDFVNLCKNSLTQQQSLPAINCVSHAEFKEISAKAKAVIRTGECLPYHNIILFSGVTF